MASYAFASKLKSPSSSRAIAKADYANYIKIQQIPNISNNYQNQICYLFTS